MTYKFDFTAVLEQWPLFLHGAYTAGIMRTGIESIHKAKSKPPSAWPCRACRSTDTSSCGRRWSGSIPRSPASSCC